MVAFEKALPAIYRIADAVEDLEDSPLVPGYDEQLRSGEDHPLIAKAMVYKILRLGEERLMEVEARRILASAVGRLLDPEKGSDLVLLRGGDSLNLIHRLQVTPC